MQVFSITDSEKIILYLNPFVMEDIFQLFPRSTLLDMKMFLCYKGDEIFFLDKRGRSKNLEFLRTPIRLEQLQNFIKELGVQSYEFELEANGVNFKNFLGNSVLISAYSKKMYELVKTLHLGGNILLLSNQSLLDIDRKGKIRKVKSFDGVPKLFDHLYDELFDFAYMNTESPF